MAVALPPRQEVIMMKVHGKVFRVDFAYKKCISKPKDRRFNELMKAFRDDVGDQVWAFKTQAYGAKRYVRCGITNLNVRKEDRHIDHVPPKTFDTRVKGFLQAQGLRLADVEVISLDDGGSYGGRTLAAPAPRAAWQAYHREQAALRVTPDKANLGQSKVKVDFSDL
jgi:hypothetical protein